jgi:hypothetical protein
MSFGSVHLDFGRVDREEEDLDGRARSVCVRSHESEKEKGEVKKGGEREEKRGTWERAKRASRGRGRAVGRGEARYETQRPYGWGGKRDESVAAKKQERGEKGRTNPVL